VGLLILTAPASAHIAGATYTSVWVAQSGADHVVFVLACLLVAMARRELLLLLVTIFTLNRAIADGRFTAQAPTPSSDLRIIEACRRKCTSTTELHRLE
jgi:hypothetical protein